MMKTKAGELAGKIWKILNEKGKLSSKELKKASKIRTEKDLYLALGWLLREDKIEVQVEDKDIFIKLQ